MNISARDRILLENLIFSLFLIKICNLHENVENFNGPGQTVHHFTGKFDIFTVFHDFHENCKSFNKYH